MNCRLLLFVLVVVMGRAPDADADEIYRRTEDVIYGRKHGIERIDDETKRQEIGKQISPITHVSADDPPTLIIHGDADTLVPIQQAQIFVDKMKQVGAEAKLVVKPGAQHGWDNLLDDTQLFVDWFDEHLGEKKQ